MLCLRLRVFSNTGCFLVIRVEGRIFLLAGAFYACNKFGSNLHIIVGRCVETGIRM